MDNMIATVKEYKISLEGLVGRVRELDGMTAKTAPDTPDYAGLARRRAMLYAEIWDLQKAVRAMEEYIEAVNGSDGIENSCRDLTA